MGIPLKTYEAPESGDINFRHSGECMKDSLFCLLAAKQEKPEVQGELLVNRFHRVGSLRESAQWPRDNLRG